jgi:hypothetical protein
VLYNLYFVRLGFDARTIGLLGGLGALVWGWRRSGQALDIRAAHPRTRSDWPLFANRFQRSLYELVYPHCAEILFGA